MLFLFRTNQIIFNLFLLIYIIILRSSYFFRPMPRDVSNDGILSVLIKNALDSNRMVEGGLVILLLFIQAVLINNLAIKHRLYNETTLLPGLFYVLLMSTLQDFFPLTAILLGNLFLIVVLDELMSTYKQANCAGAIFNAGFWVGIASLFYSSFSFFFLLLLLGLSLLRAFKLKERLVLLVGFIVPFLFVSAYFFWNNKFLEYWHTYFLSHFHFLNFQYNRSGIFLAKLALLVVFFLLGFFNNYKFDKAIQTRNYVNIIYMTLFISGLTFLFQPNVTILHFLIIMVPLSFLVTARFLSFNSSVAEFVHTILLIAVLFFQYRGFGELIG